MSATTENMLDKFEETERLRSLDEQICSDIDEVMILRAEGTQLKALWEIQSERDVMAHQRRLKKGKAFGINFDTLRSYARRFSANPATCSRLLTGKDR